MDFVKPEYKKIYNKLSNNNSLIKYLTEIGALMTTDDYYELYGTKSKIDPKIYVLKTNKVILENLTEFFLTNEKTIEKNTITALTSSKSNEELRKELKVLLGFDENEQIPFSIYREIFYSYKNSYIDNFFQNNWRSFIPETDEIELDNNEIAMSFIDAITKEFDKLDDIISDTKKFSSYEEIPEEYINHLSQLLGLEQKSFYIDNSQINEFRVLAANIIEIYKIKGTFAAFELMFKLFGFNILIEQYYFDRRFYFAHNDENKESITLNKNSYKYYLTTTNPTLNSMDKFELNEIITDKDMTERYSVEEFDKLVDEYGLECVLGYSDYYYVYYDNDEDNKEKIKKSVKYTGNVYKYFKTNYVKIRPSVMGNKSNLSSSQIRTIRALLKFLVPYFWKMNLVVNPIFDEDGEKLTVNGHRGTHEEDGKTVNDEGFRLLDSETWIYKDETLNNKYEDPNTSAYEKFQIKNILEDEEKRLQEIKKDFTLYYDYCDDYVILRDKDIIFPDNEFSQDYQAFKGRYIKEHKNCTNEEIENAYSTYKRKFTKVISAEGRRYWIKDLAKIDGTVRDERIYFNSLGERKGGSGSREGERIHEENNNITSYNVIMEPIGKKIITINSTKYWGKMYDKNHDNDDYPIYPIWVEDYQPVQETNNSKEKYFYPAIIGENHLYIPKHADIDLSKQWQNVSREKLDLVGFEGNTLKKQFLDNNEKIKIDWVAEGTDLYTALTNKRVYGRKEYIDLLENFSLNEFTKTDKFYSGHRIYRFNNNGKWAVLKTINKYKFKANKTYIFSLLAKGDKSTSCSYWYNYNIFNKNAYFSITDKWQRYYLTITPTTDIEAAVGVCAGNNGREFVPFEVCDLQLFEANSFFEKEPKKVSNMRWKKCNFVLLKDKSKALSLEKEIWNILNTNEQTSSIVNKNGKLNLNELTENVLKQIKATNITSKKYDTVVDNLNKIKELNNNILLEDFIKTHNVINYDYTRNKLLSAAAFSSFDITNNTFKYKDSLYNNMYFQNAYCIKNWDDDFISVYKLVVDKNSEFNRLHFEKIDDKKWKNHYNIKYNIDSAKSLVYVDNEDLIDENHSLLIKDKQVYYIIKENGEFKYQPINAGTILYSKDDDSNYIAVMGTTNKITAFDTVQTVEPASLPNNFDAFGLSNSMDLYQNKYKNIKEGQLIYMPQIGKVYELMFNGYCTKTNNKYYSLESKYDIIRHTESEKYNLFVERDFDKNFVFGIKEKQLSGTVRYDDDGYCICVHDEYYKGVSEQDDNDNYILNNYERIAKWDIFDGCDTDYLKDNHIDRPIREFTDTVFDNALIGKQSNKQIVENMINELIGNKRILKDIELVKREVKDE